MISGRKIIAGLGSVVVFVLPVVLFLGRGKLLTVDMMLPDEAPRALARLEQKAGHPLRGLDVTIDHKELRATLQNAAAPDLADRWSVQHVRGLRGLIDWEMVSGPHPVGTGVFDGPVRERVFEFHDVDFAAIPQMAAAALARIALQEPATVQELSLGRRVTTGLQAHVGGVRWVISVHSAYESATAFADLKGRLTGTNLAGTLRAQLYDLYKGGEPLLDAVQAFREAVPRPERIREILVYRQTMRFEMPDPRDRNRALRYDADIDGAHPESFQDLPMPMGLRPMPEFATGDVDWAAMPRLIQTARERVEMPDAEVRLLQINRDAEAVRGLPIVWEFNLRDRNGDEADITLDPAGNPRRIEWPSRRRDEKRIDFLAPDQIARFLATLRGTLDPGAMVMELVFRPDEAIAVVRDPDKPQRLARLQYGGFALKRNDLLDEPPGVYFGERYEDSWLFELRSLGPGLPAAIRAAQAAAAARLAIKDGEVEAVGVGRHADILSGGGGVNIEVDIKGQDRQDGRFFADLQGHVLRVDAP